MIIQIRVIPGAKKALVKQIDGQYRVYIQAPAIEGKANKAIIPLLAEFFKVKKRQIQITKGLKSRDKTINIENL